MGIFSFLQKKEEKNKLVLVFYIGSSSIGGALFWTQKSGVPNIVFSVYESIALEENVDPGRFLSLALRTLDSVASKVQKAGFGIPDEAFCILSSVWYVSQTRIIRLEKNVPFLFTAELGDSLIQKEKVLFEEEHGVKYSSAGAPVRIIELKNVKTTLNGYETPNPLNQSGKELEMTIFISMSGEAILAKIEETIQKYFHKEKISFSSFAFSSFTVVRDIFLTNDFLLVHVGGEASHMSMIKRNVLQDSISFPLGINFLIRGVASSLGSTLPEAKSFLSLFKDGHAAEPLVKKLTPVIDTLKVQWLSAFQDCLSKLSNNNISIPATVYLMVDKELTVLFSEIIKTEQFHQYTLTESKFKVVPLGAETFHGMAVFEESISREPGVIINSIYINRLLDNR